MNYIDLTIITKICNLITIMDSIGQRLIKAIAFDLKYAGLPL